MDGLVLCNDAGVRGDADRYVRMRSCISPKEGLLKHRRTINKSDELIAREIIGLHAFKIQFSRSRAKLG